MIFLTVEPDPTPSDNRLNPDTKRGVGIFCPDRTVHSVLDIDPQDLVDLGMKGVILDLDNTLVLWHREEITEEIIAWLERVKAVGLKLCILSNSVLSNRSERIAERLGCPNVRQARKPSRSGFRRAMNAMGTTPRTTAMIGDQMFTDILGGNRMRLFTIMVTPMNPKEFAYTRYVSRPPERLLLRYFRRRGQI
jgi:HAD superfamily phosphatase (TIGR01668 family)